MNESPSHTSCRSCCSACCALPTPPSPGTSSSVDSPYVLHNLLPVGTISLPIFFEDLQSLCDHQHANDGWHTFSGTALLGRLTNEGDTAFCRELEFLLKHKFVSATCRVIDADENKGRQEMRVRIYVIPFDLANVQGKLRVRKDNVRVPARKYMKHLLPRVVKDAESWEGGQGGLGTAFMPHTKDARSLAELYGDLSSPSSFPTPGWEDITSRLLDFTDDLSGFGMRSMLYKYQRRTVAAMMQRELDLRDVPDPLFIPLQTIHGKPFYLQPGTMEVLLERPVVAPCRGSILCEELGTGKTVMVLSLILSTLHQLPTPEESIIDDRPVLTPLSFTHFPTPECITARRRFCRTSSSQPSSPHVRIPSLTELLIHRTRTAPLTSIPDLRTPHGIQKFEKQQDIEEKIENIPLSKYIKATVPFYHHYFGEPVNRERNHRAGSYSTKYNKTEAKTMYLSSATLVVVPANLLSQWEREIVKHCEDGVVKVLTLRKGTKVPDVRQLAGEYDIVLMTYTRYTAEATFSVPITTPSKPCKCPPFPWTRIPNCTCPLPVNTSPLLQIRWKRLVIDEGHVSATLGTHLIPFTKQLSVERRWIVTGTPTSGLLGLSFGSGSGKNDEEDELEALSSSSSPNSSSSSSPVPVMPEARIWTKHDRSDLTKLGNMITHFVGVPQFSADPKLISTHVTEPLLDPSGPRPGAIEVLRRVMEGVMLRHRIEDVEEDVVLPPVKQEWVLLDLDPIMIKSYNALQATIAINAIDSQRTDQDYIFHPSNSDALQLTVKNMSQLMFWSVDDQLYNIDQLDKDAQEHIDRAIARNTSPDDMKLLYDAFRHVRVAASDPLWRAINMHEDVPYDVYEMIQNVFNAWTRIPSVSSRIDGSGYNGYLHADRLQKIHDMISARPLIKEDQMMDWGKLVKTQDRAIRKLYEEAQKKKGRSKKGHHGGGGRAEEDGRKVLIVESAAKKAASHETIKEMQKELGASMARLEALGKEDGEVGEGFASGPNMQVTKAPVVPGGERSSILVASSLLARVRVGTSASSKVNYIINEVLEHSPREKFLIFSESELSLVHVAEALELAKVKFLRFTTQIPPQLREQLVLTFETSETYRVFLMELKHGARGLNLISASRVIFCEPVWQADVESQAIKRAHRIGQTKPITVKTLAIRGTAEENMVARRNALKDSTDKLPKLIEESGMRHFIANPKFIEDPPERLPKVSFKLFNMPELEPIVDKPSGLTIKIPSSLPQKEVSPKGVTVAPLLKRARIKDPEDEDLDALTMVPAHTVMPLPKRARRDSETSGALHPILKHTSVAEDDPKNEDSTPEVHPPVALPLPKRAKVNNGMIGVPPPVLKHTSPTFSSSLPKRRQVSSADQDSVPLISGSSSSSTNERNESPLDQTSLPEVALESFPKKKRRVMFVEPISN